MLSFSNSRQLAKLSWLPRSNVCTLVMGCQRQILACRCFTHQHRSTISILRTSSSQYSPFDFIHYFILSGFYPSLIFVLYLPLFYFWCVQNLKKTIFAETSDIKREATKSNLFFWKIAYDIIVPVLEFYFERFIPIKVKTVQFYWLEWFLKKEI